MRIYRTTIAWLLLLQHSCSQSNNKTNYFVDVYEGGQAHFAYPIDVCVETGFFTLPAKYVCNDDGTQVTRTYYKNSECKGVDSVTNFTSDDTLSNGIYSFNCNGVTSFYEQTVCINIDLGHCNRCLATSVQTQAVGICHYGGNSTQNRMIFSTCDENGVWLREYMGETTCTSSEPTVNFSVNHGNCGFWDQIPSNLGTFDVWATVCKFANIYIEVL